MGEFSALTQKHILNRYEQVFGSNPEFDKNWHAGLKCNSKDTLLLRFPKILLCVDL